MSSAAAVALKVKEFDLLEHGDYGETDLRCTCALCEDWRAKLAVLQKFQSYLPRETCPEYACHPDLKGPCADCRLGLKARMTYLAALNRRDLYSECSFHASMMESQMIGRSFMQWVRDIIDDRANYPDGWWTNKAPHHPLQFWITMFKQSIISGVNLMETVDDAIEALPRGYLTATSSPVSGITASGLV